MASKSTAKQILTLYYGTKECFAIMCNLNYKGLIPSNTLIEAHINKKECIDAFGDEKSNNGFKISKNLDLINHVNCLWKRIHQASKPVTNDIGLHFCQGLLYEKYHGLGSNLTFCIIQHLHLNPEPKFIANRTYQILIFISIHFIV